MVKGSLKTKMKFPNVLHDARLLILVCIAWWSIDCKAAVACKSL